MSNRKILGLLLVALAIAAVAYVATIPAVKANPDTVSKWNIRIKLYDGNVLTKDNLDWFNIEEIKVVYFNESGNCVLAYNNWAQDGIGSDGNITIYVEPHVGSIDLTALASDTTHKYNVSVWIKVKGIDKWLLVNWTKDLDPTGITGAQLVGRYVPSTATGLAYVEAGHLWGIKLSAFTDLDGDGYFETGLYAQDAENLGIEFPPYFEVYWGATKLAKLEGGDVNGSYAKVYFNISDTWADLSESVANCWHVDDFGNVSLWIKVYWHLGVDSKTGTPMDVWVGNATLKFQYIPYDVSKTAINITDSISGVTRNTVIAGDSDHLLSRDDNFATPVAYEYPDLFIPTYTFVARVNVTTFCGQLPKVGAGWEVVFEAPIGPNGAVWKLLKGDFYGDSNWAPVEGLKFPGALDTDGPVYQVFWLPNITPFYGKNMSIIVTFLNCVVHSSSFNTSAPGDLYYWNYLNTGLNLKILTYSKKSTKIGAPLNYTHYFEVATSVVPTKITVKDSGVTPQPLDNAFVYLKSTQADRINTGTDGSGRVFLPPSNTTSSGTASSGAAVLVRESLYHPIGYLPVPWSYVLTTDEYTYSVEIWWAPYFTEETPVPVTKEGYDSIALNVSKLALWAAGDRGAHGGSCDAQEFVLLTNVFEVDFTVKDLCGNLLSSTDWPGARLLLYYELKNPVTGETITTTLEQSIESGGSTAGLRLPGGKVKVRLYWKGVVMAPYMIGNETLAAGEEKWINISGNILQGIILVFPIGNLNVTVTQWDIDKPLMNISVTIDYIKDGNVIYSEPAKLTNCDGQVEFEKVPLRPLPKDISGHEYKIVVRMYTSEYTPYIRHPQDDNILVGEYTLSYSSFKMECTNYVTLPAWIYSPTIKAVDHEGNVLKTFHTDVGDYEVVVVLNDTTYGYVPSECVAQECVCAPDVLVDYRIVNMTGSTSDVWLDLGVRNGKSEAIFVYTSDQFNATYPHLFVAGAKYHFLVFFGGILVYNYTITLPRPVLMDSPSEPVKEVVFFNESSYEVWNVTGTSLNYTWSLDKNGEIVHPILRFTGDYNWTKGGARFANTIELVTWVQTLKVYPLSNAGRYIVPHLNLTLIRDDALNWTYYIGGTTSFDQLYKNLTKPVYYDHVLSYAWNSVGGDDGIIEIQVPVWVPSRTGAVWSSAVGVKFGAKIPLVYVLAGADWSTPFVPDTPFNSMISLSGVDHNIFGYIVNFNETLGSKVVEVKDSYGNATFYPGWFKYYDGKWVGEFRGGVDFIGDYWNMTLWCGAAKIVHTTMLDGFCVLVEGPDTCLDLVPLPNQPVTISFGGYEYGPVYTGKEGYAIFYPKEAGRVTLPDGSEVQIPDELVVFKEPGFKSFVLPVTDGLADAFNYTIKTWINYEDILKPYGLKDTDLLCKHRVLVEHKVFREDNNIPDAKHGAKPESPDVCVKLTWDALLFKVLDWSGKPLRNAMLVIYRYNETGIPYGFNFSKADGTVLVYVPSLDKDPNALFSVNIYWRDSLLLEKIGAIPRSIVIYSSIADEQLPRYFFASGTPSVSIAGATYTQRGATIYTYVYVGLIKLFNAEGKQLSEDALKQITVTITWPDGVVTQHKPETDGTVPIILNKNTAIKWPHSASSKYSPESPHPQTPLGDYVVSVKWAGTEIYKKTFRITKGKSETPEFTWEINLPVSDITFTVKTPFGTLMSGATVKVVKPDGTSFTATVGSDGTVTVKEVPIPLGAVKVTVVSWRGFNIGYTAEVTPDKTSVIVSTIGKIAVAVKGSRGQGLPGASVSIAPGNILGTTDSSGTFEVEVPAGSYTVTVSKGGKTASTSVTVAGGKVAKATLTLDIFMTIAGWDMSMGDFVGLLLLLALLVIVLFIIAHEYSVWRRKRIAKALVPAAKPSE